MDTTTEPDTDARRRFSEANGFRPDTLSAAEAEHRKADAEERLCRLVVDLDDERSPLVDAMAAAAAAVKAVHDNGHPSAVVRMSRHLDALIDAHQQFDRLIGEVREQRIRWSRASDDARGWRDLDGRG